MTGAIGESEMNAIDAILQGIKLKQRPIKIGSCSIRVTTKDHLALITTADHMVKGAGKFDSGLLAISTSYHKVPITHNASLTLSTMTPSTNSSRAAAYV